MLVPSVPLLSSTTDVNPAGPLGEPNQLGSANDVRNTFSNMGFDDRETVSLVGGAHAFGKCHGACPNPPCGEGPLRGIGPNTFTSGFEGAWTVSPTEWDNIYFQNLFRFRWELITGPGGLPQWTPFDPQTGQPGPNVIMLTADLAFSADQAYRLIAEEYANSLPSLERDFAASWYRLVTQDMGPVERCIGDMVPPAQPWQLPLPAAPRTKPNFVPVRSQIQRQINNGSLDRNELIRLAFNCANTFRSSDFSGGCNGARIRFPPQINFPVNSGLFTTIQALERIHNTNRRVSFADLIVLAGQTALEDAGGVRMKFCGGRVDGTNADFTESLAPRDFIEDPVARVRDAIELQGLNLQKGIALFGRPTSRYPSIGSLFGVLVDNELVFIGPDGDGFFRTSTRPNIPPITSEEYALMIDRELRSIVQQLYDNPKVLRGLLAKAWTMLMINDRFKGAVGNVCFGVNDRTVGRSGRPVRRNKTIRPGFKRRNRLNKVRKQNKPKNHAK